MIGIIVFARVPTMFELFNDVMVPNVTIKLFEFEFCFEILQSSWVSSKHRLTSINLQFGSISLYMSYSNTT